MSGDFGPFDAAALFGALLIAIAVLVNARAIGEFFGVMDLPDAHRKRHAQPTPLVGGIATMLAAVFWAALNLAWKPGVNVPLLEVVLLCGAGATLIGYADDQSSTTPSSRLLSLVVLAGMAMAIDPSLIPVKISWENFGPTDLPKWVGMAIVCAAIAGYVNAVNMADGQNGIVSGMFAIWAVCLMIVTGGTTASVALVMAATVVVAFLFNMSGRIFLGDTGSYGISFVFAVLAIQAHNRWGVPAETIIVWFCIPVLDCLRLLLTRMLEGRSPFDGDRNHLHHHLQDRIGKTAGLCTYLGVVGASSLVASKVPHLALACMVVLAAFYFSFAWLTVSEVEAEKPEVARRPRLVEGGKVVAFEVKESSAARE